MGVSAIKNAGIAGVLGFIGVGTMLDQHDKNTNYIEVTGHIRAVEEVCFLEKDRGKIREYSDTMDCDMAVALEAHHPTWEGFTIMRTATLTVRYDDPVAQDRANAEFEIDYTGAKARYSQGDDYTLLAHKEKSGKTRKV